MRRCVRGCGPGADRFNSSEALSVSFTWSTTCRMPVFGPTDMPTPTGSASGAPPRDQPKRTAEAPCAQTGLPAQSPRQGVAPRLLAACSPTRYRPMSCSLAIP